MGPPVAQLLRMALSDETFWSPRRPVVETRRFETTEEEKMIAKFTTQSFEPYHKFFRPHLYL